MMYVYDVHSQLDVDDDDPSTLTYAILSETPNERKFRVTSSGKAQSKTLMLPSTSV